MLEGIHSCLSDPPMRGILLRGKRNLVLETKDLVQILDLSLSAGVVFEQVFIGWMNQNKAMYINVIKPIKSQAHVK